VILAALAVLAALTLRETFRVAGARLPGLDAGIHYVWEFFTRTALEASRLPYWNPYHFAGMPHLATLQVAVLYPPAMLLRWLPLEWFLPSMFVLHLWIAGSGALLLCRVIGLGWLSSTTAAIAFMFGGSVAPSLYQGHMLVVSSVSWFPWALALSIVSARRDTWLPHSGLVLVLVVQALSGLQASLYTTAVVSAYFVYSAAWPEQKPGGRSRPLVQLAVLGVLTAGLCAFQLLPFARVVLDAGRTAGVSYDTAVENAWSFKDLATLFFPFLNTDGATPYAGMSDRAYVGWILALALPVVLVDRAYRRSVVFFVLLAIGALAFALGDNVGLYRLHYAVLPALRQPGRFLFIATLAIAVLGACGLERFVDLARRGRWRSLAVPMAIGALALASAVSLARGAETSSAQSLPLGPSFPFLAGGALLAITVLATKGWCRSALALALIVVGFDVTTFAAGAVHTVPVASAESLRSSLGPPRPGRAVSLCGNRIGPAELLIHRQPTIGGLGGVSLRDYADWSAVLESANRPSDAVIGKTSLRLDLLDLANVSTLISCEPLSVPSLTLLSSADVIHVYDNAAAWPRAIWTCEVEELPRWQVALRLRRGRYDTVGHLVDRPVVDIRWSDGISDGDRVSREKQYQLRDGVQREGSTWRYG
jgi:hypothetical protein